MISEFAVLNLLYSYAEAIDSGDFAGAAALFRHARVQSGHGEMGEAEILALWTGLIVRHEDGTPRTKHVITNPIVEVDEPAGRATIRSYYTVIQLLPTGRLEPIACGRYHDEFERVNGTWRFSARDYGLLDLPGDLSHHLHRPPVAG